MPVKRLDKLMARRAKYRLGKDVNLKKEIVRDLSGRRITDRRVKQIVKKVRKKTAELDQYWSEQRLRGIYFDKKTTATFTRRISNLSRHLPPWIKSHRVSSPSTNLVAIKRWFCSCCLRHSWDHFRNLFNYYFLYSHSIPQKGWHCCCHIFHSNLSRKYKSVCK